MPPPCLQSYICSLCSSAHPLLLLSCS
uniref:Uncharacterized protein n=1 Tax=Anguilla anguilla TaxID=7936 RepID=A0A0E9QXP1_ANGAN